MARAVTECWSARRRAGVRSRPSARSSWRGPANYIAQPTLALSTCPSFDAERHRAAPRRPPALCPGRRPRADRAGRAHARCAARRLARGQFVAGRRHQGHLGAGGLGRRCSAAPPKACSGCRARSSAPRTWRALPKSGSASRSRPTPAMGTGRNGDRRSRAPAWSMTSFVDKIRRCRRSITPVELHSVR